MARPRQVLQASIEPMDADILTTEELAQWLKCPQRWLEKARGVAGGGPPFLVLDNWLIKYSRRQVLAWLEENRQFTSTSQYENAGRRGRPRKA